MATKLKTQADLVTQAERVQSLLLDDMERILTEGECSPTDRATIARYLMANNFRVDANNLPRKLADLVAETKVARGNKPRILPSAELPEL